MAEDLHIGVFRRMKKSFRILPGGSAPDAGSMKACDDVIELLQLILFHIDRSAEIADIRLDAAENPHAQHGFVHDLIIGEEDGMGGAGHFFRMVAGSHPPQSFSARLLDIFFQGAVRVAACQRMRMQIKQGLQTVSSLSVRTTVSSRA